MNCESRNKQVNLVYVLEGLRTVMLALQAALLFIYYRIMWGAERLLLYT